MSTKREEKAKSMREAWAGINTDERAVIRARYNERVELMWADSEAMDALQRDASAWQKAHTALVATLSGLDVRDLAHCNALNLHRVCDMYSRWRPFAPHSCLVSLSIAYDMREAVEEQEEHERTTGEDVGANLEAMDNLQEEGKEAIDNAHREAVARWPKDKGAQREAVNVAVDEYLKVAINEAVLRGLIDEAQKDTVHQYVSDYAAEYTA